MKKFDLGLSQNHLNIIGNDVFKSFPSVYEKDRSFAGQYLAHIYAPKYVSKIFSINEKTIRYPFTHGNSESLLTNDQFDQVMKALDLFSIQRANIQTQTELLNDIPTFNTYIKKMIDHLDSRNLIRANSILASHVKSFCHSKYIQTNPDYLVLSHLDLHGNNLLWDFNGKLAKIIDFDQSSWAIPNLDTVILALRTSIDFSELNLNTVSKLFTTKISRSTVQTIEVLKILQYYIDKVVIEKFFYFDKFKDSEIMNGIDSINKWEALSSHLLL